MLYCIVIRQSPCMCMPTCPGRMLQYGARLWNSVLPNNIIFLALPGRQPNKTVDARYKSCVANIPRFASDLCQLANNGGTVLVR